MTIESQERNNARHAELTELAKWNVCLHCSNEIIVAWDAGWKLWCRCCGTTMNKYSIKPKPTRAEEVKERLAKMELAAAKPTNKYNIDEIIKEL